MGVFSNDSSVILLEGSFWAPFKHDGPSHAARLDKMYLDMLVQAISKSAVTLFHYNTPYEILVALYPVQDYIFCPQLPFFLSLFSFV